MPKNSSESETSQNDLEQTLSVQIANDFWHAQSSFLK